MKLISIEPTPSPNSMKLNVDETLPRGRRLTYQTNEAENAPEPLRGLLLIEGVRSLFRTADFIALDRKPGADWARILAEARVLLQAGEEGDGAAAGGMNAGFGEAQVLVQMFRGIPIQVRVRMNDGEVRSALPAKFTDAVNAAAGSSMIRERKLEEFGVRYGEPEEIAQEIVRELDATYTDERLSALVEASLAARPGEQAAPPAPRPAPLTLEETKREFQSDDWQVRYAALERYVSEPEGIPLLAEALRDENASIRRLAVVYLGDLRSPESLPLLFEALKDKSSSVRRTAGDTLSDMGDPAAIGPMIEALKDKNKLVRWRAARFLYEAGDESAVDALEEAAKDSEFEIQLQAQIALERIKRGEEAAGTVWQQMTAARNRNG
ncbi:conserved virulence factor C family protein [Paenibacillus soyae]|uniref:Conserved virulence factor C family protein n=1 Tax=Paenibacillus soyae TaxID=2969249 RepID=A0A9X2SAL2_9BACL|nr:conserved virulence factor C family protein [Paenibacillus soyae]MCR2806120.1 conserved virulence factor C family protein [Paenibacillus soyae]